MPVALNEDTLFCVFQPTYFFLKFMFTSSSYSIMKIQ